MGIVAAVVGVSALVGGTAYNIVSSENAKGEAKRNADDMKKKQDNELKKAEDRYTQEETDRQALIDKQTQQTNQAQMDSERGQQQSRQRKRSQAGISYRDTILTGPQGLQASDSSSKKTLLGM